jgi:nicotinic acid mononucleotide adenylyltransferase
VNVNDRQDIARAASLVARVREYVRREIQDTAGRADPGEESFSSRLLRAFEKAFTMVMESAQAGRIDPFVDLVSTKYGPEAGEASVHEIDRPIRAGFLALASNPLWWGHLLVALMAQGDLDLDTVVFRVQGQIDYKDVAEENRVSVKARHRTTKTVLAHFYPLFRYTDLGSEPDNSREGADELHRYFSLNQDRAVHLYYLVGAENRERVSKYSGQQYRAAKRHGFGRNPKHRLTIAWIQRGQYGAQISEGELAALSDRARESAGYPAQIPFALVQDSHIDLGASSTQYRDSHDPVIVPSAIDRYARTHSLYGY